MGWVKIFCPSVGDSKVTRSDWLLGKGGVA